MSFHTKLWFISTLLFLAACGETAVSTPTPPPPTLNQQAQLGKQVFTQKCGACHSTSPDTIIVGPSLAGIASLAESRVDGQDSTTYLLNSIMQPSAYLQTLE